MDGITKEIWNRTLQGKGEPLDDRFRLVLGTEEQTLAGDSPAYEAAIGLVEEVLREQGCMRKASSVGGFPKGLPNGAEGDSSRLMDCVQQSVESLMDRVAILAVGMTLEAVKAAKDPKAEGVAV